MRVFYTPILNMSHCSGEVYFIRNVDCDAMCQTPGFNWTQSMVLDFAYCGAAYLDGLSVNGSLRE